jgi:transcriptional regulator with XRE-family HTH domain
MERFAAEIGRALRRARRERGLTLRQVAERSRDRFKPTSIAGYERGERSVSVERFSELSAIYGIPPDRLLADALRRWGGRPEVAIDPTRVEGLREPEARLIADFVKEVLELRGEPRPESITLRAGDLEILATGSGRQPHELLEEIHDALLQASGPQTPFR